MTDELQDQNKILVPSGWSIRPSTLKTLQEAADTFKRHNETIQRSLEGPMKDWTRFFEFQKKQQAEIEAALKTIHLPKLDLEWINDAASALQRATARPVYFEPSVMMTYYEPETSSEPSEEVVALREANTILRQMVEEQRRANGLQEELLKKQKKDKTRNDAQVLILDQDYRLFIQKSPKKYIDLTDAPQKKKILFALTNNFTPSKELFTISGCASKDSFYKAIEELKTDAKQLFRLKKDFITNNRKQGYCITSGYSLHIK